MFLADRLPSSTESVEVSVVLFLVLLGTVISSTGSGFKVVVVVEVVENVVGEFEVTREGVSLFAILFVGCVAFVNCLVLPTDSALVDLSVVCGGLGVIVKFRYDDIDEEVESQLMFS